MRTNILATQRTFCEATSAFVSQRSTWWRRRSRSANRSQRRSWQGGKLGRAFTAPVLACAPSLPPPHLLPMSTFPLPHYMCFSSPFIFRCVVCSKTCMTLHLRRIGNARPTGQRESPLGRLPGGGRCAWPKMYVLKLARYRNSNNICGVNFMPLIEGKITVSVRKIFAGLLRYMC